MSKVVRERLQQTIQCMEEATQVIERKYSSVQTNQVQGNQLLVDLLTEMQDLAIAFGTRIEQLRGIGTQTVTELENYCECLFHVNESMDSLKLLDAIEDLIKQMEHVKIAFEHDFPNKKEMVFLPYKASMWDSLESVWKAADADPECEAYVIPIPYYDKNPDGTLGALHYEGDMYPDYVPITDYKEYKIQERRPDAVFIHNPYDAANVVTSVDPFYYSNNLKKYTECLVYIPYYATSGDMAEGQALCPAYLYADYIVIQHESFRELFDERIPDEKFLAFGSPKFDRIIHMCQNPPEIPDEWKKIVKGKKVYFYNTSITGMLENTQSFLKKMAYVFQQFENRKDACILWRPHPLLESTFASMRKEYLSEYKALKQKFIDNKLGIYDNTPSIENSIVLSDAYIGDAGSSVTSLFGVVGKPLFILNNRIHRLPEKDDWKGTVYYVPHGDHEDKYTVIYGNQLYYSPNNDGKYQFYCNLSSYASGNYYYRAIERNDKIYVFPLNAENILVIDKSKNMRVIPLEHRVQRNGAFRDIFVYDEYVFIAPYKYPDLVRFDMNTETVEYIRGVGSFNIGIVKGQWKRGARCLHGGQLRFLSYDGKKYLNIDAKTMNIKVRSSNFNNGYAEMIPESEDRDIFWLFPYEGTIVKRWNEETQEIRNFDLHLDGMTTVNRCMRASTNQDYFSSVAFGKNFAIFAPYFGNKFVKLDLKTEQVEEWKPPFDTNDKQDNCYYPDAYIGRFYKIRAKEGQYLLYNDILKKTYHVDLYAETIEKTEALFSENEICKHVCGFASQSQWMRYGCCEDVFHTLKDFLDETLLGEKFSYKKQIEAFANINASIQGDCGEKVYEFVSTHLGEKYDKSDYIWDI